MSSAQSIRAVCHPDGGASKQDASPRPRKALPHRRGQAKGVRARQDPRQAAADLLSAAKYLLSAATNPKAVGTYLLSDAVARKPAATSLKSAAISLEAAAIAPKADAPGRKAAAAHPVADAPAPKAAALPREPAAIHPIADEFFFDAARLFPTASPLNKRAKLAKPADLTAHGRGQWRPGNPTHPNTTRWPDLTPESASTVAHASMKKNRPSSHPP